MCITKHMINGRQDRVEFIESEIGFGVELLSVYWDRGHYDGAEYHHITNTGIIIVENCHTHNIVTVLIATPRQIIRYYKMVDMKPPKELLKIAKYHEDEGWNYK